MAEKYKGKKYNAYIHTEWPTFTLQCTFTQSSATQYTQIQQTIFVGVTVCSFLRWCVCVCAYIVSSSFRFVLLFILCVFVDISCIRIMFCTQLAPFVFRNSVQINVSLKKSLKITFLFLYPNIKIAMRSLLIRNKNSSQFRNKTKRSLLTFKKGFKNFKI